MDHFVSSGPDDASGDFVSRHFARPGAGTPIDRALRIDSEVMLVDDPVKRVDNMTMAWGLEARVPFLDHELVVAERDARAGRAGRGKRAHALVPSLGEELEGDRADGAGRADDADSRLRVHQASFLAEAVLSLPSVALAAISTGPRADVTILGVWWRRVRDLAIQREDVDALGIMLMEIDAKLERVLDILEDEDEWQEEEEADRP